MFVGIGVESLEEGRRGVYEEHALPPACWHRGREGEREEGGEKGRKGVEGGKVAVRALGGRVGRVPSLSTQARDHVSSHLVIEHSLDRGIAAPTVSSGP